MKSKPNVLLLVFLFFQQTTATLPINYMESLVLERASNNFDVFTVNMLPNYQCLPTGVQVGTWCDSFFAAYHSGSCKCICRPPYNTFLPSIQTCGNATLAGNFGGCDTEYFDDQRLLNFPVNLAGWGKKDFSTKINGTCMLSGSYYVHDYSGFRSRWKIVSDGFFNISVKENGFEIEWKTGDKGKLSGRIIRLVVTCNSYTRCVLLKAIGSVTYTASDSSSMRSTYHAVSSAHVETLSLVTGSSSPSLSSSSLSTSSTPFPSLSLPPPPPPSSSSSSSTSSSLLMRSSSLSSSSSVLILSASSSLSPSPSLALTLRAGTSALPQPTSSFIPWTQSQTTRIPASTTGHTLVTSRAGLQSLLPVISDDTTNKKTTSAIIMSSSTAGGGGSSGDKGTQTSEKDNGVVIGAAVGGAFVLAIIVIFIVVFWKRRKAGKTTEKQTKQVKDPVYGTSENDIQLESPKNSESQTMLSSGQDNQPTYQGLIIANGRSNGTAICSSPEDEYDNCTVYQSLEKPRPGTPVYQSLKTGQAEPVHTTGLPNLKPKPRYTTLPNTTGPPIAKGKTATEVPKPNPGAKGQPSQRSSVTAEPVYNALGGPGSDQRSTPEPLYNVLEGLDTGQDYEATNVDPLYNVLEGPNATYDSAEIVLESNGAQNGPISGQSPDGDPLYNVLEGPESDQKSLEHGRSTAQEPLYNVLEGLDAEKSPLVDQGGPINEPLYNVLEGPDSGGSNQHAPNKPRPLSGHDNLAYEQTLEMDVPNAAVQRPWTQRESVYEALRGPTQDMYEALGQSSDPHSTC